MGSGRIVGAVTTALLGGALAVGGTVVVAPTAAAATAAQAHSSTGQVHASPAKHTKHADTVDFTGIVALDDCSGSLVKATNSADNDPALVLTNGHCYEGGFLEPGQVIVDQPSSRSITLLDSTGKKQVGTVQATKVSYATMTDTDITLYQLNTSYAQIEQKYGVHPLAIASDHPKQGADIRVVSGYWQQIYSCGIDGFAYELEENGWTWKDAVRYTPACHVIGGTSGSPVIDTATDEVVAINNTTNENGEQCTLDNPCEVDANGNVTVHQGIGYAEETYEIDKCVDAGNTLDLNAAGCTLPKPSSGS
ncbi:MAG: trypsin-like peptidase domain-containing protein [Sciscionella sp.]|nr:trypsin-like peptidase domain-containing protein [Sciscionella sp.]